VHKRNYSLNNISLHLKRQNSDIQALRKYNKTIRENCFDEKGNFKEENFNKASSYSKKTK